MLKIGFWQCLDFQNNPKYFFKKKKNQILGEDALETLRHLFIKKFKFNFKIEILKLEKFDDYDAIIFVNWPTNPNLENLLKKRTKPNYLLALEGPTIDKKTWRKKNHNYFNKIFTWNDLLVSSNKNKYKKVNFPCYKKAVHNINFKKNNFLISISSNKNNNHFNDLYSCRLNFINWAEKNNYDKFDFYGYGWNKLKIKNRFISKLFNVFKFLHLIFKKRYRNYMGEYYGLKKRILKNYKFSICFENSKNYDGWITEKIFHCFFSGCVPIYYGASNICDIIPKNCYIDYRNFKNNEELTNFLENMSNKTYQNHIKSIKKYLTSNKFIEGFGIDSFTNTIIKEIRNDLLSTKR